MKALLNGQGADEIFTGYTEHYCYDVLDLFLGFKWKLLIHEFGAFCKNKGLSSLKGATFFAKTIFADFVGRKDRYHSFKKPFVRERGRGRINLRI